MGAGAQVFEPSAAAFPGDKQRAGVELKIQDLKLCPYGAPAATVEDQCMSHHTGP